MGLDLAALQRAAEAAGRECRVGAVVVDRARRVFTPRRASVARVLPGLWDVVGGHVEDGESLLGALSREVTEETGWVVVGDPLLVYVGDWETTDGGRIRRHREFDFLVDVEGDVGVPRLDPAEHDDFRWVDSDDLGLFDENQGRDGGVVRRVAEVALRSRQSRELTYPHLTLFVPEPTASEVDQLRNLWDPVMAAQIAPHVTVAYPDEVGGVDAARDLVESARRLGRFDVQLGAVVHDGDPRGGLFIEVDDVEGGWGRLREHILSRVAGPAHVVPPHVTVVHPRTSGLGASAWAALAGVRWEHPGFSVTSVALTAFDGRQWRTIAKAAL